MDINSIPLEIQKGISTLQSLYSECLSGLNNYAMSDTIDMLFVGPFYQICNVCKMSCSKMMIGKLKSEFTNK